MNNPLSMGLTRLFIVASFVLLLSACGGSDDGETEVASNDETNEQESNDASAADDAQEADGEDGSSSGETDENGAALAGSGDDAATDLAQKPPVADDLLGEFDELNTIDLVVGDGDEAVPGADISMQYVGVLASDGTEFDSSWSRGAQTFDFTLGAGRVIAGWDQGIVGMKVGGRRVLQIPSALGYGDTGSGAIIEPGSDLIFIVDLVSIAPPPEPAPPIPDEALGEFDELGVIDLVDGEGREAVPGDVLAIDFVIGNATTGEELDSTWARGETNFRLIAGKSNVLEGFSEGVVGMREGGQRVLQIPSEQAGDQGDVVIRIHVNKLIDAPYGHTLEFEGSAPTEPVVTTIEEGTGDGVEAGQIIVADVAVVYRNTGRIVQSTWQTGTPSNLFLSEGALLPGLNEALLGIKVGEIRQIELPAAVAFPDGIPPENDLEPDDAVVFVVEVISIEDAPEG